MKNKLDLGVILYRPNNGFYKIVSQAINANTQGTTQYTIEDCDANGKPATLETCHVFAYDLHQAIIVTDENRAALAAIQTARSEVKRLTDLLLARYRNTKDSTTQIELLAQIKAHKALLR